MKKILLATLSLFALLACQNNKLKTSEKSLTEKIITEEEQLARKEEIRKEKEQLLADSISHLPKGFRFKEKREVDLNNPPELIDLANSLNKIKQIKLSSVLKNIEYIRMENIPDATLPNNIDFKYYIMNNYIVGVNVYGIHLFSKAGKFIHTVVKNELTGYKVDPDRSLISIYNDQYTKKGATNSVWSRGNNLYYNYINTITGQNVIMELDCSNEHISENQSYDPENPNKIIGLGKVCIDINNGINKPEKPIFPNGMTITPIDYYNKQIEVFNSDRNTYITQLENKNMYGIISAKGDTLANFRKLEQLKNYTKTQIRGVDYGCQYEKNGQFFFRSDYNDTVFKVIPPNQIKPVYVLNLGQYKVSKQEGVDPDVSLEGKIIPINWADAKDYIFITFTKDSYVCSRNIKNKSLKVYFALYTKATQQLNIVESDPKNYDPNLLENDIDGGFSVWPSSYMIGKKGEILISLKGADLKEHLLSSEFKNSTAPIERKEALKQLANSCSAQDNILMLVN